MKKYRAPKAKPGELKMQYGKLPYDSPDICMTWGDGCSKRDGNYLYWMLCCKRQVFKDGKMEFDPSFIEELEARGYDVTTIKFSIQKKPLTTPTDKV